jgi:hypothetical protein
MERLLDLEPLIDALADAMANPSAGRARAQPPCAGALEPSSSAKRIAKAMMVWVGFDVPEVGNTAAEQT